MKDISLKVILAFIALIILIIFGIGKAIQRVQEAVKLDNANSIHLKYLHDECVRACSINVVLDCTEFTYKEKQVIIATCAANNDDGFIIKYSK